jgi:hypothetical protein
MFEPWHFGVCVCVCVCVCLHLFAFAVFRDKYKQDRMLISFEKRKAGCIRAKHFHIKDALRGSGQNFPRGSMAPLYF